MNSYYLSADRELLVSVMAAVSVFCAVLFAAWPYLTRNTLGVRIRRLATDRERTRIRKRARLAGATVSLKSEPKRLFKHIVDWFHLTGQAGNSDTVRKLRMAGFRGQAPIWTFLAFRVIGPIVLCATAALYTFVVINLQQPLILKLGIVACAGVFGYYAPSIYLKNRIDKRQKSIRRSWPEALDLLLICVEAGMAIESAFRKVAEEIGAYSTELAEELSLTTAEMSFLQDRRKAYENLGERTGVESIRSVLTSLIQAEKYGTSVGQSLRVLAQESRDTRMGEAEKKAAALPPKLTVPMILFFLPVLFAVIIAPAAIQIAGLQ